MSQSLSSITIFFSLPLFPLKSGLCLSCLLSLGFSVSLHSLFLLSFLSLFFRLLSRSASLPVSVAIHLRLSPLSSTALSSLRPTFLLSSPLPRPYRHPCDSQLPLAPSAVLFRPSSSDGRTARTPRREHQNKRAHLPGENIKIKGWPSHPTMAAMRITTTATAACCNSHLQRHSAALRRLSAQLAAVATPCLPLWSSALASLALHPAVNSCATVSDVGRSGPSGTRRVATEYMRSCAVPSVAAQSGSNRPYTAALSRSVRMWPDMLNAGTAPSLSLSVADRIADSGFSSPSCTPLAASTVASLPAQSTSRVPVLLPHGSHATLARAPLRPSCTSAVYTRAASTTASRGSQTQPPRSLKTHSPPPSSPSPSFSTHSPPSSSLLPSSSPLPLPSTSTATRALRLLEPYAPALGLPKGAVMSARTAFKGEVTFEGGFPTADGVRRITQTSRLPAVHFLGRSNVGAKKGGRIRSSECWCRSGSGTRSNIGARDGKKRKKRVCVEVGFIALQKAGLLSMRCCDLCVALKSSSQDCLFLLPANAFLAATVVFLLSFSLFALCLFFGCFFTAAYQATATIQSQGPVVQLEICLIVSFYKGSSCYYRRSRSHLTLLGYLLHPKANPASSTRFWAGVWLSRHVKQAARVLSTSFAWLPPPLALRLVRIVKLSTVSLSFLAYFIYIL